MKIRLIIPECSNFNNWYCEDSDNIDERIKMLNQVMHESDAVDLVVTCHNYLAYYPSSKVNVKEFIIDRIIPVMNKKIANKKPLLLGFDLLSKPDTKKMKGKASKRKYGKVFNPFGGISAVVCFMTVKNGSYYYKTHIWECWLDKGKCSKACFEKQNQNRIQSLGNMTIGLLSCGDIAKYCHNEGELLPKADIYIDLSHKSLRGRVFHRKVSPLLINEWKKCKHVLVTQQVKDVSNYLRDNRYPYVFPQDKKHKVKELFFNDERAGVMIDVFIP